MAPRWISVGTRVWSRLDIDQKLLISMARNSLPPTAALWIIQSSTLGRSFDVVGYLPIILCILQQPIVPRIQFLKAMLMTCILSCSSACIALLAGFCSTKARLHTTQPGGSLAEYNSSAAVVSGIWLLFAVWAIQTFRVFRPQYTTSCVIATIMAIVAIGSGANLYTTSETTNLVIEMLQMFFLAHAFCTAVNLFIFPTTSRNLVFTEIKQYLSLLGSLASSEAEYIHNLAHTQPPTPHEQHDTFSANEHEANEKEEDHIGKPPHANPGSLISTMMKMTKLHAKLREDLHYAQHDIGWSTLDEADLGIVVEHFRKLILSLRGMCALMPLFDSVYKQTDQTSFLRSLISPTNAGRVETREGDFEGGVDHTEWRSIFLDLEEPTKDIDNLVHEACSHVLSALELDTKPTLLSAACFGWRPKASKGADVESKAEHQPGTQDCTKYIEKLVTDIHIRKGSTLQSWRLRNGSEILDRKSNEPNRMITGQSLSSRQEQLYVILFMQHLFQHISNVMLDLVRFADSRMLTSSKKKRLILPNSRHIKSFIQQFIGKEDIHEDFDHGLSHIVLTRSTTKDDKNEQSIGLTRRASHQFTIWTDVLGSVILTISDVVGSHQSFFGFRVACAVMCVVIVGLLGQTQEWFFNHRALWAAVFIPFSMSPNAGETLSLLIFRMIGSAWALGLAIVNWYIVDGHPAGVIVFYFIFQFFEEYFVIKFPQYGSIWRPAMITRAIITGYTLQTQVSQTPSPPATTVGEYPIYLIGPYRYTCTAVGVFVAFIWTIFPQAVSARTLVRKKLGISLSLLALYYNCMHSTVGLWATGQQGNLDDPKSPSNQLRHTRDNLFAQELMILEAIRGHIRFSRFEPSMGRTFRKELYQHITDDVDTIIAYMNMVVYAAGSLSKMRDEKQSSHWEQQLSQAFLTADFSSHSIAVILSMLSVAVSTNQPLPPGLSPPQPYQLTRQLQKIDPDMLDISHVEDAGYAAFAVIEIATSMMYENLKKLVNHVKELVGIVEFVSFDKESNGKQI